MLTYDPQQGFLIDGKPADLYGRVGRNVLDVSTRDRGVGGNDYDPRYYQAYTYNNGDAGEQTAYRLRPEYQERLGNRVQVRSHGVGGYGEIIDPSQVNFDEEFGLLTDQRNIKDPATPRDNLMGQLAMAAFALPAAYAVAVNSGLLGAAGSGLGGAGSGGLGTLSGLEPIALPALEGAAPTLASIEGLGTAAGAGGTNLGVYGGMTTSLDGLSSASLTAGGGAQGIASATQALTGGSSAPWYSTLLQNAQSNLSNPITASRALMGAAQLANSLSNRDGGANNATATNDGGANPLLNLPAFNPLGLLVNYKPREIKPVPFMTRTGLL